MRNVSALRVKKPTGRLAETRALENPRNRPSISIHEIPQIPVDPANYRIGTEALIQMAGNGGEKPEVVTDQNTQFQEKPPSQDQIAPQRRGWTSRDIRRDIAWVLGAITAILFGAVRPEVDHPHDFWAAAAGAISLLIAIGLYLYDLVGDWIRPVLTLLVFGILMAGIFAERWTRDFRTAQLVVEKPPPQGAATGTPQTQLFHVTTGASLWTPFVPSMSITPVSVIHNDGSISPVNITLFVDSREYAIGERHH
jgi:hypothetical protein